MNVPAVPRNRPQPVETFVLDPREAPSAGARALGLQRAAREAAQAHTREVLADAEDLRTKLLLMTGDAYPYGVREQATRLLADMGARIDAMASFKWS